MLLTLSAISIVSTVASISKKKLGLQSKYLLLAELAAADVAASAAAEQPQETTLLPLRTTTHNWSAAGSAYSQIRKVQHNLNGYVESALTRFGWQGNRFLLEKLAVDTTDAWSDETEKTPISEAERSANGDLAFALTMLTLMGAGYLFYPPLLVVRTVGSIYAIAKNSIYAYRSLGKKHLFTVEVLDTIIALGIFYGGYYLIGMLSFACTSFSRKLIARSEDHSHKAMINIFGQQPKKVWVAVDEVEVEINFAKLQVGDTVIVGVGQMIPIDGIVRKGAASVDQHVLTGEAQPVEKGVGESVLASTVVLSGKLYIEVEKAGTETTAAQIATILEQTTDFKQSIQTRSETICNAAVLPTLALSVCALPFGGVSAALGVLESPMGYNLRLTGPISILNFLRLASQQGILVKDGRSLEMLKKVDTVIFDKTGTLTQEQPQIAAIYPLNGHCEDDLLALAAAAEARLSHPIAKAIVEAAQQRGVVCPPVEDARYQMGYGVQVTVANQVVRVGSQRFMQMEQIDIPLAAQTLQIDCHRDGYSVVMIAVDEQLGGLIVLKPTIRPEAAQIVKTLQQRGLTIYVISGDQEEPTRKLAEELGIDHYFANTLPEQKAAHVEQLQQQGHAVCFVGDGINDSIALKTANVSVSMRGATTVATDTAQVILMDKSLKQLTTLFEIGHEFDASMRFNEAIAVVPGIFSIAGVFLFHFGFMSAVVIYIVSLIIGSGNAMLPMFTQAPQKK